MSDMPATPNITAITLTHNPAFSVAADGTVSGV